ncbi:MAG TPA: hypothetical protein PLE45_08725 [Spirochaetota bacterium]|nr:hypothetical protein [Spirochaetota bacterium]HOL57185.1 hypothetical protein [Spirochaetota bacterium]HPP04823.1 hypothetical protein [Spirochaetota bacterium]
MNNFKKFENDQNQVIEFVTLLKEENRILFNNNKIFYYLKNRSETNQWSVLLDKSLGELWIEILYPDSSGNNP